MVEHGVQTLLFAVEGAGAEHGLEHLPGAGGVFDDRALRGQIALQDGDAAVGADGVGSRADDVGAGQLDAAAGIRLVQQLLAVLVEAVRLQLVQILAQRLAGDGHSVEMEHIPDLLHDGRHAAGIVEELCGPAAGRADVQQVLCAAMETVEGVAVDGDAKFMGDSRQMEQGVGGAGDGRVDHDSVLEAVHRHDVAGAQALFGEDDGLIAGPAGVLHQIGAGGRQQGAARQGQTQSLSHDLHGGGGADEAAGAAAGAGVLLGPVELCFVDLAALILCAVHTQLLQRQQLRACVHGAAGDHHRGDVHPGQAHEVRGHTLVAAGNIDAAVKGGRVGVDLDHVGDHLAAGEAEVDAVGTLTLAVADVGGKVPGAVAAGLGCALAGGVDQLVQMAAAGVAVAKGAFYDDLRLGKFIRRPAGTQTERVQLGSQLAHFLTSEFHNKSLYLP